MFTLIKILLLSLSLSAAAPTTKADYVIKDFKFASGDTLPELRIHYRTLGTIHRNAEGHVDNAVLILHGTGGTGGTFLAPRFAGELFGAGQPLDTARYFIILPDSIGHGESSKPSDGLRGKFPKYGYRDIVEAQHRLIVEGLKIDHLRLVMGTSMGGMHTWLWGERYPEFMDALMPLASLPTSISGRNRLWRRIIIDSIRSDPSWQDGNYTTQPRSLRIALALNLLMADNSIIRQAQMPTMAKADTVLDEYIARLPASVDANDLLYSLSSSNDYDPSVDLEKIKVPLTAVNFGDDLINPPELGILEREIKRIPKGRAVIVPAGPNTKGHGSHTYAALWKTELVDLLARSAND
jgi:homoserine O-acetyltransferase